VNEFASTSEAVRVADAHTAGPGRVSASIDGAALWFASDRAALRPAAEAFASAALVAALHHGRRLVVDGELSRTWHDNMSDLLRVLREWWGYPEQAPLAHVRDDRRESPLRRFGLCFSGGVDSFYALLRGDLPVDALIFVHGFDIDLDDTARYEAYAPRVREIAAGRGIEMITVRTNVRKIWPVAAAPWDRAHGGPLAAVGHVLADRIGHLIVPSGRPWYLDLPWGSHWKLDALWSSARLRVLHSGAHRWRADKIAAIADEPLVREHLRVCWEHRNDRLNCGRCEKCVRTQLLLAQLGKLADFRCFDGDEPLAARVEALPRLPLDVVEAYRIQYQRDLPADLRRAVERLLDRSRPARGWPRPRRAAARARRASP
jgi:hypothetical protein